MKRKTLWHSSRSQKRLVSIWITTKIMRLFSYVRLEGGATEEELEQHQESEDDRRTRPADATPSE